MVVVVQFLKDWQTLVGALLALFAAIWTIQVIRQQAADEKKRVQNQLNRKKMAARAHMPDALSGICAYAEGVGHYLTEQIPGEPEAPTSALADLKLAVEHIDDAAAARTFELLSFYQVQRARLEGARSRGRVFREDDLMYDIVLLQAYVNSLFEYARNEVLDVSTSRPSRSEMQTACRAVFSFVHISRNEHRYAGLNERIERRHGEA